VTLNAELNGVDQTQAEALVAKAHTICPYSKATRGNIEVKLQANGNALQQAAFQSTIFQISPYREISRLRQQAGEHFKPGAGQ
jgi:hypothetical protein